LIQKGCLLRTLFVLTLSVHFAIAQSITPKTIDKLSKERYWSVLLHIKNGKSEIDDPSFFLTKTDPFSPFDELNATIKQLVDNNSSMSCKYPARIAWLKKKLPKLFKEQEFVCEELKEKIDKEHIQSMTLVFPTAYINSPASMFGHTFLRLDKDEKTPLLGEAVNYAAQTEETNGLIYTYNGLFGGYKGYYSMLPYYKKIEEYAAMEQRDMWEYTLDLDEEEIRKVLYHLYEMKGVYGDYYFFTKNCSYNLLWLLESAGGDLYLVEDFSYKAIPIDTIRALEKRDLIAKTNFRPSKRREIKSVINQIENVQIAKKFSDSYDLKLLDDLNDTQKAYTVDLAVALLKQKRSQRKINKQNYISHLMKLLKYRSRLPEVNKPPVQKGVDPLKGHKSARVAVWMDKDGDVSIIAKPAMHDIYDISYGYIPGAYIDFFRLDIEKSKFKSFDFVSVHSYTPMDAFFKPFSWEATIQVEKLAHKDDKNYFSVSLSGGASWNIMNVLVYALMTPQVDVASDTLASVTLKAGMLYGTKKSSSGILYDKRYFSDGIVRSRGEIFWTRKIGANLALNLKFYEDKIENKRESDFAVGLFYYF